MIKKILKRPIPFFYFLFIILLVSVFKFSNMPVALYPNVSQLSFKVVSRGGDLNKFTYHQKYGQSFEEMLLNTNEIIGVRSMYYKNYYRSWEVDFDFRIRYGKAKMF